MKRSKTPAPLPKRVRVCDHPSDSEDDAPFAFVSKLKKQPVASGKHVHVPGGACCAPPRLSPPLPSACPPAKPKPEPNPDAAKKHKCDLCDKGFRSPGELKHHKAAVHGVGDVKKKHACDLCDKGFRSPAEIKRHQAAVHGVGDVQKNYTCDLCDKSFENPSKLKRHNALIHRIDIVFYKCNVGDCRLKCTTAANLKKHKASVHGIDVVFYECGEPGCNYKATRVATLKKHRSDIHDEGVIWSCCDVTGCGRKFKQRGNLARHMESQHNDVYVARRKQQEERVSQALLAAGWTEHFASSDVPPVGTFKREKRIDFKCANVQSSTAYCRIDFVVSTPGGLVFLEVDEDQHRFGYQAELSCDMRRMCQAIESLAMELGESLPHVYWVRYNPNAYHVDGDVVRVPKEEREKRLIRWLDSFESPGPLGIGYAFYDKEEGSLCVLDNEEYSPHLAEVVEDLGELT